jgi:hypothetical protein
MLFPPQEVPPDAQLIENARVWEIAHRFRSADAHYAAGGALWQDLQKHGIDPARHAPFLELARLLYSPQRRNLTAALLLAEDRSADSGNAAFVRAVLDGAWEREGIAGGGAAAARLEDCAWRLGNLLCHVALGYRRPAPGPPRPAGSRPAFSRPAFSRPAGSRPAGSRLAGSRPAGSRPCRTPPRATDAGKVRAPVQRAVRWSRVVTGDHGWSRVVTGGPGWSRTVQLW